jgi:ribonuclease R
MVKKVDQKDSFAEREAQKYEHPIPSREYIIDYLTEKAKPVTYRQLLIELKLETSQEQEALRRRLLAMARDGQLHQNRRGAYGTIGKMELIAGRVIGHKDGFGFVNPDDGGDDLFLNARQMRTVFHGDRVLVSVAGVDNRNRREGAVVEVLERNTKELVGRLVIDGGASFIEPSNQRISQEILIPAHEVNGAQHGQMVVVEITEQPTAHSRPLGRVAEVLGEHMAPGMEIDVAIRNHGLPHEWPPEVIKEMEDFTSEVADNALGGREDLRALPFVTIDGEDAKDFDDAVYTEKQADGSWTLYVAIADVSYYVKLRTALDEEALNRGNSVYFPERVIPMLPEVLSNGLCSLRPNINRLTMVCEMSISATGKITKYRFFDAVIKSHARLTYNKVYAMVDLMYKNYFRFSMCYLKPDKSAALSILICQKLKLFLVKDARLNVSFH